MQKNSTGIKRDNMYVGELVMPFEYRTSDNDKLIVYTYEDYRNILFSLNENMEAYDVLYETPCYPIVNITDDSVCLDSKLVVKDAICLGELLKYFGYPDTLTVEDIYKIRSTFFTGEFCLNNASLFGYQELTAEDMTYYDGNKQIVTDPVLLEERRERFRKMQSSGHRMVKYVGNEVLSSEYFNSLDKKKDYDIYEYLCGYVETIDSFAPIKKEGHKRVLRKY